MQPIGDLVNRRIEGSCAATALRDDAVAISEDENQIPDRPTSLLTLRD
jgi:hypothetical protein